VGQGSSNVILLGGGRAVVVDCGPKGKGVPLDLLKRYVATIEALVISHNDGDHDRGVAEIVAAFPKAITRIFFLADRPAKHIRTLQVIRAELEAGNLLCQPERIEAKDVPQIIYQDTAGGIVVKTMYPTFTASLDAESAGPRRANRTSAVICLLCERRSIVLSGDATIEAWDSLATHLNRTPIRCDVMTAPHHGGLITGRHSNETKAAFEARERASQDRLYSKIISPGVVIVSVGSNNSFTHPCDETIGALRRIGIPVMCTEITPQCCSDLERIRPGVVAPMWPSRSTDQVRMTKAGRSKDVACAGTIVAEVSDTHVHISPGQAYRASLAKLQTSGDIEPRCL